MPSMDQVAWQNCNVLVGAIREPFSRGSLLPEPVTAEESSDRMTLRLLGAVRVVEVVYTAEELADQARARGEATAAREVAHDVDPTLPMEQQVSGSVPAGLPTIVEPSGSPVVIGDEDLRAEHEQQAAAGRERAAEAERVRPPSPAASKVTWVKYAVEVHGADRGDAERLNRDQLVARYRPVPGAVPAQHGPPTAMDRAGEAQAAGAGQEQDTAGQEQQGEGQQAAEQGEGQQAEQGTAGQPPSSAPSQAAGEQQWRDYAVSRGADPLTVQSYSKAQLIAEYGPACD